MRSIRTAILPLLALSMIPPPCALARTVTIAITGTVASGTDVSGVFGKPGSQLSGKFTLIFTFDDSMGNTQPPKCTGTPPYSPQICTSQSPAQSQGTASLQIGDSAPFEFGVSAENVSSSATRTTWVSPISSYRISLGVGDGRTMVAGYIGSATPKPAPPMSASQLPPASAAWDYPISDSAATSAPGISFTIDDRQSGAKAYGLLAGTTVCVGDACPVSASCLADRPRGQIPEFKEHYQLLTQWCWVATAEMLMENVPGGTDHPQCAQVGKILGRGSACCPANPDCNMEGSLDSVLKAYGFRYVKTGPASLTRAEIKASICHHNPIIFYISNPECNITHAEVIYGWEMFGDTLTLMVYDPGQYPLGHGIIAKGREDRVSYDDLFGLGGAVNSVLSNAFWWPLRTNPRVTAIYYPAPK